MQAYDLIMLIVLGMATIFGAIKGFAWQVASIASIVVSYIVAYRYRFDVAEMIQAKPPWNQFLAMLILYAGTSFVIWVVFRLISGMIDRVRLKEFDRHLGAVFGLAKGLIYCLLITMFAMSLLGPNQQAAICQSKSGYYITKAMDTGLGVLPKEIHDVVGPYLVQLDNKLKKGQGQAATTDSPSETDTGAANWTNGLDDLRQAFPDQWQNQPDSNEYLPPSEPQMDPRRFDSQQPPAIQPMNQPFQPASQRRVYDDARTPDGYRPLESLNSRPAAPPNNELPGSGQAASGAPGNWPQTNVYPPKF